MGFLLIGKAISKNISPQVEQNPVPKVRKDWAISAKYS
jgi:hypothetical protein